MGSRCLGSFDNTPPPPGLPSGIRGGGGGTGAQGPPPPKEKVTNLYLGQNVVQMSLILWWAPPPPIPRYITAYIPERILLFNLQRIVQYIQLSVHNQIITTFSCTSSMHLMTAALASSEEAFSTSPAQGPSSGPASSWSSWTRLMPWPTTLRTLSAEVCIMYCKLPSSSSGVLGFSV